MRARLLLLFVCSAPATWGSEKLGFEADLGTGPIWSLNDRCRYESCPSTFGVSVRAGYEFLSFASVGLRADAVVGPEGSGRVCGGGSNCADIAGYRAGSLLLEARLHTIGTTQLFGGVALGAGRLVRLQCSCGEQYDIHGTGLPVLEVSVGVRTYVVPRMVHLGIEGSFSAMFGAETAGATFAGPPIPQTGITVSAIGASFVMGVSL